MIASGVEKGANLESERFVEYFEKYAVESRADQPNPRLLHRIGNTISRRTASDDVRHAISDWDDEAIDGFNTDHLELMRLYFREALAKAQQVEALPIDDDDPISSYESFHAAAELLESVISEDGKQVFDGDIPTLLRDIGNEIRDLGEAEQFTTDDRRRAVMRRRRLEAVKNGSIYIGRVLFFTSLFVVLNPAALSAVGSVASILGLMDIIAPGSVRGIYEKLRVSFPILPKLTENPKVK